MRVGVHQNFLENLDFELMTSFKLDIDQKMLRFRKVTLVKLKIGMFPVTLAT